MINRALNQKTGRHLGYEAFLDLARDIGCVGVDHKEPDIRARHCEIF